MRVPSLIIVLTLVSVALAGCTQSASDDDDGSDPVVRESPFMRVESIVDGRGGQGEPSLGVTLDGTLFTTGLGFTGDTIDPGGVYRSTDGGVNWTHLGAPTAPTPNLDPDLFVDVDGTVWFDTLWVGCATVTVSRDMGDSWSDPNPAACTGPGGDRQYVVATGDGEAYIYYHQLPTFQQTAAKTTDYGQTWIPTGPVEFPDHHLLVNEGSGWGGGGFWNPVTDSVFFTWSWFASDESDDAWYPGYAVTRDGGLFWVNGFAADTEGDSIGLSLVVGAADEAGNVYIAWAEQFADRTAIYVSASTDDGQTWGPRLRVDESANVSIYPAITAGADGEVAIAYYEADRPGNANDMPDEATWKVRLAWTTDVFNETTAWSHADMSNGTVKTGSLCPNGAGCGGDREFLDYFQAKRLPDGRIGAVWNKLDENGLFTVFGATEESLLSPWGAVLGGAA